MFRVLLLAALFQQLYYGIFCNAQYDRKARGFALLQRVAVYSPHSPHHHEKFDLQGVDEVYDSDGNSALHIAAKFFNLNAFTALLDAGFSPTHKNAYSETPFDLLLVEVDDNQYSSRSSQRQLAMIEGILKHAWTKGIAAYKDILQHFKRVNGLDYIVEQSIYNTAMTTRSVEILFSSNSPTTLFFSSFSDLLMLLQALSWEWM